MNVKNICENKLVNIMLSLITITSCTHIDPYDNFKNILQAEIGKKIDNAPYYTWRYQPKSISEPLPNGNIEYKYEYISIRGICRYIFEVSPITHTVISWRYDGEDKDKACFVNP